LIKARLVRARKNLSWLTIPLSLVSERTRRAAKERERYSGPALGAAVDMELASEAAYTFANVQKAKFLGSS
jgi:hypothetical protein